MLCLVVICGFTRCQAGYFHFMCLDSRDVLFYLLSVRVERYYM